MVDSHNEPASRLTPDAYRAQLARCIAERGQAITAVTGAAGDLDVAYTIGNHERGFPELLAFGPKHALLPLLDKMGRMMRSTGRRFASGELVDLGGRYPVKVVTVESREAAAYATQVANYYATDPDAVAFQQVVLCDQAGAFPDDPSCALPHAAQPMLRAVPPAEERSRRGGAEPAAGDQKAGSRSLEVSRVEVDPATAKRLLDGSN